MSGKLSQRENLLRMYRRQGYEYAPVAFVLCDSKQKEFFSRTGRQDYNNYYDFPYRVIPDVLYETYPRETYLKYYKTELKPGTYIDDYGTAHEPGSEAAYHMTYMRHPLENASSVEEILSYEFPKQSNPEANIKKQADLVKELRDAGYASYAEQQCTVWEKAWYVRSMPELMTDMMMENDTATVMLDIITEHACFSAKAYAQAGVDILFLGDDIGMQHTAMMSNELYRQWLKPRLIKVINTAKEYKPDILIQYHSCGFVEPFIDDLIEAGVDILNPVQPECMDFSNLHNLHGDRLSFNGTLGTQSVLPFGTADEVYAATTKNLKIAGEKGGLFCCPTHMVEPEVPFENIEAYVRACREFKVKG